MPLPIVHERARTDIVEIANRIAVDQLAAALRFCDAAEEAMNLLAEFPEIGPEWQPPIHDFAALRFWPIKGFRNFLVFYRPLGETVEILRVLHGAREIGRAFPER